MSQGQFTHTWKQRRELRQIQARPDEFEKPYHIPNFPESLKNTRLVKALIESFKVGDADSVSGLLGRSLFANTNTGHDLEIDRRAK